MRSTLMAAGRRRTKTDRHRLQQLQRLVMTVTLAMMMGHQRMMAKAA
jgi:hypothetical protein